MYQNNSVSVQCGLQFPDPYLTLNMYVDIFADVHANLKLTCEIQYVYKYIMWV